MTRVRLSDVCTVDWGNTNLTKSAYVANGKFLAVSAAGCDGRINHKEHNRGTPVLSAIGAQCGRMFFPDEDFTAIKNTITLTPDPKQVTGKFLYYFLTFVTLPKRGAGQPFIAKGDIEPFEIPLPPLPEQIRIADMLSRAEKLIAQRKESLALLDELVKSRFVEMFGDPVRNEKGWRQVQIDDISDQVTDGEHTTPKRTEAGIMLLSARNVKNGYLDFDAGLDFIGPDEYARIARRCKPEINDILMSCSGSVGRVALVSTVEPFSLVRSVALIKLKKILVEPRYVQFSMTTHHFQDQIRRSSKSSSQTNIFTGAIKKLLIPLPPLPLQNAFASFVEKTEALKRHYQQSLGELENLYGSLSQRAFGGG